VLLGAPPSLATAAWSAAQALLTSLPLALAAPDSAGLSLLLRADAAAVASRRRLLVAPALASLAGAWLGACVLPYDWNLPWQTWPETSLRGAAAGFVLGGAAAAASRTCWAP